MTDRRAHGTGEIFEKGGRWYGRFYVRGRRVKRSLGPVRRPGSREGLTRGQAEARMWALMSETSSAPAPVTEQLTLESAGMARIRALARKGRKQDTTLQNYESEIRCHFAEHFGQTPMVGA